MDDPSTNVEHDGSPPPDPDDPLTPSAQDNLETIANLTEREHAHVGPVRAAIERIGSVFGRPGYFLFVVMFIVAWVAINGWGTHAGWTFVDKPPFYWLQGLVSSNALLLTVSVLIKQERMAQLETQRAHLDLQINMLTERKVTKILELVAAIERRHDASPPEGDERHQKTEELLKPADAEALMGAIKRNQQDNRA